MSLLLEVLGETPELRVLDFFLENDLFDHSMADVEKETNMARVTARKVIDSLAEHKLIVPTRKVGKAQLFKLNKGSAVVGKLLEFDKQLSFEYADKAAEKGVAKAVA